MIKIQMVKVGKGAFLIGKLKMKLFLLMINNCLNGERS